jgi:hypothetical protein
VALKKDQLFDATTVDSERKEGKKLTFLDYWSTERNKLSMPK